MSVPATPMISPAPALVNNLSLPKQGIAGRREHNSRDVTGATSPRSAKV
jgi:hypothetical protein